MDDFPSLGYTRRVIEEVLRLNPPTWLTARSPGEDDALGGYIIPARALVFLSPDLTHRHPAVWEDPEWFDPERFTEARAARRPAFAYFPFGGGPRRCIGSGLATTEVPDDRGHRGPALPPGAPSGHARRPRGRAPRCARAPLFPPGSWSAELPGGPPQRPVGE